MLVIYSGATPARECEKRRYMDIDELRKEAFIKVLLWGSSGRGKTFNASKVTLELLEEGYDVLYCDTESEGSTTMVQLIDEGEYDEEVVDNLDYVQVDSVEEWYAQFDRSDNFDLMVIDTLDHKHSYVVKGVADARRESDADWNEYPQIYGEEKNMMERIGKPETNIIATIDPDSGKSDKPKGAQTNVRGYFTAVIQLTKSGDEYSNKILNWVGKTDWIGKKMPDPFAENLAEQIEEYI